MNVIHPSAFARRIADEGIKVYPVAPSPSPVLTAEEYVVGSVRELAAREFGICGDRTVGRSHVPPGARKARRQIALKEVSFLIGVCGLVSVGLWGLGEYSGWWPW